MHRQNRRIQALGAIGASLGLLLSACGDQGGASESAGSGASEAPQESASQAAEAVDIEWYIGLGTGTNPEQRATQEEQVTAFNADHPNINLTITVVDSEEAEQDLATRMPTDPPDIIGPVGIRGLQGFGDSLLDLTPFIDSAGVDRGSIEDALWDVYVLDDKQIGIPMAVYPSFIYYNKTHFDEAGLAYPPHEVGEQYEGEDWTWDTVRDLALQLTVDTNGNDATSPDFDETAIDVWGLDAQFTNNDPRAWATIFGGAGSAVADDGTTAQWPDNWREGLQFLYDAMWTDHIFPTRAESDGFQTGNNNFQTGRIAMEVVHQWYTCCIYPGPAEGEDLAPEAPVTDWDVAVLPVGPDGNITSKLHADTVGILDTTENPEEAFEVLNWIRTNPDLLQAWGALPAVADERQAFYDAIAPWTRGTEDTADDAPTLEIDWNVSVQMMEYPDVPSHEASMPNFPEANAANGEFGNLLWTTPGLDLDEELTTHLERLQGIFDEAQ